MSARKLTQPATSGWTSFSSWSKSATGAITLSAYAYPAFRMLGTKWVPVDPTVHPRSDPAQPFSAEGAVRPIRFGTTNARLVELELDKGPVTLSAPAVSIGKPHLAATGLTYSSIASDADLQYAMSNTGVEASIVLRSSKAPRQYTFHIADTGGQLGNVQAHPDGSFEFGGRIDGDVNIALAAPMAFEEAAGASGGPPAFDRRSAAMTVTKVAGGFDVTVGVRSSWIAGKTFPIELDPSVYFTEASPGFIAGYSADAPYACGAGCGLSQSGNLAAVDRIDTTGAHDAEPGRSFYRFDLSKIPQGATVSEAHFQQALIGCPASNSDPTYVCTQNNYVVELHPMTGAWDGTATWASLTPLVGSSVISSLSIPGFNCYYCYTTEVWSGLAPAVQGWVNQPWTNFGFAAKLQNESPNVGGPIWAFRNSSETPALCLHITYTPPPVDPATLRAGGSASSNLQPCSQGGNPVNCDTGSFWHTLDELKVPGRGVPLHFNLTYDSSLAPTATSLGFGWTDSYNMNLSNDSAGDATIMQENGAVASFVPASGGCNNVGFTTPIAAGSAAGYQSLAADCSGHVWVWGANNDGQLGDGTTTNHATPEMLTSLSNIIGVAGGTFHSLALGSDGTVWSWGDNSDGELGNGTTTQSLIPVHLSGISGVVAIAAGYFDSLALRNDGSVWAWGNNASGELGNGSTTNSSTPVQVSGLANVTSIAAAGITSLALKSGGTVWAWGDNSVGQVGNGSLTNSLVPVQAFSNATAIAGGYLHSMAIRSDGTVWTWGYNSNGQLGNGSTTSSTLPVEVSGLSAVTAIAGGAYFSLALKNDGTLWGWGDNSEGQLGANVLPGTSVPVQCCPNNLFGAIAAGGFHSLGLNASGAPAGAFGWGWNHEGEVGDGTTTTRTQPVSVNLPSGGQFAQPGGGYVGQHVLGVLSKEFDGSYVFYRSTDHGLFMFSSNGQLATESDLSGNRTTLTYNSAGQLTTVTDPANRALTLAYSGGNLQSVTDPAGRSVTFGYDGTNQLTLVVDPNGGHTQFTYNPDGSHLVRAMERPRQAGWVTNTYDSSHRVTLQTDEMQRPTTFDYTSIPGATKITDPSQNVTVQQYQNGELTSLTKGFGTAAAATWSYLYDSVTLGVAQITDPNRHVTKQTWDPASGMLTSSKDPLLRLTLQTWNPTFGFLTSRTDAKGVATTFTYDSAFNVLNSSTPQLGSLGQVIATRTTAYQYGQDGYPGDLTTTTDPDGKAWKTGYDAYGDVTTVTDPLGDQTTYGYGSPTGCGTGTNGIGLRTSMVSPRGNAQGANPAAYTTAYQYDCLGDLTRVRDPLWNSPNPSQHQVVRTYDADINLSSMTDGDGNTTSYTYDAADELKVVTRADNSAPTTDYNADGTVADQKDGKGNPVETYGYDSLARVITETDALGSATQYAYDPAGNQLTKQDSGGNCSATPATGCTTMGYDAANELTGIAYSDGVTPNVNNITYDADGQRTAMTDGTGSSSWSWDSLRRLTAYTDGHGDQVQYQYNLRGLVTQLTYPGKGNVTRGYDDAGRLALVQDWLGNKTSFGYDADNNLTAETLPPGTNEVDTTGYNAADQLTSISDVSATVTVFGATYGRDAQGSW